MKKIVAIGAFVLVAGCSLMKNDNAAVKQAEKNAITKITEVTDQAVKDAKDQIDAAIAERLERADTTLSQSIHVARATISHEVEKANETIRSEIADKKKCFIRFACIVFALTGIVVAIFVLCCNRNLTRKRLYKEIVRAIADDPEVRENIRMLENPDRMRQQANDSGFSRAIVERYIDDYVSSRKFMDVLAAVIGSASSGMNGRVATASESSSQVVPVQASSHELFARNSTSMILSDIRDSYQRGKSIYKLILADSDSDTAEVDLCLDQDDAVQRILRNDNQFLEPVCMLRRESYSPNTVTVKNRGWAEKLSNSEWKVTKAIIVELK